MLDFELLLFLFTMLAIGGLGSRWGPVVGAITIMVANELMKEFGEWRMVAIGMITFFMVVLPEGIVGLTQKVWRRWGGRFSGGAN